jgi:tRNA threonylcarbamoyladenosine biosynthesis protein TsaE
MMADETGAGRREYGEDELITWGLELGGVLVPPLTIALRGDLGAGKSTLARAIARGAGVAGPIPSPTYNLLFRYEMQRGVAVVHADLYRLEDPEEVWALGWSDLPGKGDILLIEWPERAEELLPQDRWEIHLEEGSRADLRTLEVLRAGDPPEIAGLGVR